MKPRSPPPSYEESVRFINPSFNLNAAPFYPNYYRYQPPPPYQPPPYDIHQYSSNMYTPAPTPRTENVGGRKRPLSREDYEESERDRETTRPSRYSHEESERDKETTRPYRYSHEENERDRETTRSYRYSHQELREVERENDKERKQRDHKDDLVSLFGEAHQHSQNNEKTNLIELEARLGIFSSRKFVPGISSEEFNALKVYYSNQDNIEIVHTETVNYLYRSKHFKESYRLCIDKESTYKIATRKTKIKDLNLRMSDDLPYHIRVTVAREKEDDVPDDDEKWVLARSKNRWSFKKPEDHVCVDMTIVETSSPNSTEKNTIYEVEFEVDSDYIKDLKERDKIRAVEDFLKLINNARSVLALCTNI